MTKTFCSFTKVSITMVKGFKALAKAENKTFFSDINFEGEKNVFSLFEKYIFVKIVTLQLILYVFDMYNWPRDTQQNYTLHTNIPHNSFQLNDIQYNAI